MNPSLNYAYTNLQEVYNLSKNQYFKFAMKSIQFIIDNLRLSNDYQLIQVANTYDKWKIGIAHTLSMHKGLIYLMAPLKVLIILLAIFSMHLLAFKIFLVLGKGLYFFLEETNLVKKDTFSRTLLFFFDPSNFKSFNGVSFFLKPHKTPLYLRESFLSIHKKKETLFKRILKFFNKLFNN